MSEKRQGPGSWGNGSPFPSSGIGFCIRQRTGRKADTHPLPLAHLVCSEYTNQGLFSYETVYVEVATADKTQEFMPIMKFLIVQVIMGPLTYGVVTKNHRTGPNYSY